MKLADGKFGSNKTYYKLKDNPLILRILPAMGELADSGTWSVYYRINYGYVNSDNKSRPFQSTLKTNGKKGKERKVEIPDAAVERYDKLKASYDAAVKAGDEKAKETLVKLVGGMKSRYNVDSNHYMNVVDLQGNIGILKIRHKCKQQLDIAIKKLRDKGINPVSIENGRFFVFTRSGTGQETTFNVEVYKQEMEVKDVGLVERDVVHKMTPDLIGRLESEAGELNKLFKKPTASQIEQIVAESNLQTGISPNIDKILGTAATEASGDAEPDGDDDGIESGTATSQEAAPAPAAPVEKPAAKPRAKKTEAAPAPTETKLADQVESKPAPASAPQTTAEKVADMSDDEFLKSLGIS